MALNTAQLIICALTMFGILHGIKSNQEPCDHGPMDIVLVLDASSSIWPVDFMTQLKFVYNLTTTFNIGPAEDQTRVALLTFSSTSKVEFNLNKNMNKLKKAIGRVRHLTGGTNTADAIKFVADDMFLPKNGGRADASHIVIVITDGESYYKEETASESKKLREKGVTVFAIGVGPSVDLQELNSIASKPSEKFVLEVFNYRSLQKSLKILTQRTCEVTVAPFSQRTASRYSSTPSTRLTSKTMTRETTTTPVPTHSTPVPSTRLKSKTTTRDTTTTSVSTHSTPVTTHQLITTESPELQADREKITKSCGGKPADVFFLLDTSSSIHPSDFKKQLDFVRNVVDIFDISYDKTRVGLSTFSHDYNPIFGLEKYYDKNSLLDAITAVPYSGGGTDTGNAIKYLRENQFSRRFTRPEVAHVIIILTDGLSRYPKYTANEAALVKKTGTYVFAVGIGNSTDQRELSDIASKPDTIFDKYVFNVTNFDGLGSLKDILAIKTCEIASFQQDEKVCRTAKTNDVIFVFDAAYVGHQMSNIILDIIEQVSMYLATTAGTIKTGIHTNSCLKDSERPLSIDPLEAVQDYDALSALVADIRSPGFWPAIGGRQTSTKMVVVFVESLTKSAEIEIQRSKFRRNKIVLVQVGSIAIDEKISRLAGRPHLAMNVMDHSDIPQTVEYLKTLICEGF